MLHARVWVGYYFRVLIYLMSERNEFLKPFLELLERLSVTQF